MTWHDMTWHDMTWHDIIWYDMLWYDMIWHDMTWHDMITWHVLARYGVRDKWSNRRKSARKQLSYMNSSTIPTTILSFNYVCMYVSVRLFIYSFTKSYIDPFIYLFISQLFYFSHVNLSIYSDILFYLSCNPFIHSFIRSFINPFITYNHNTF